MAAAQATGSQLSWCAASVAKGTRDFCSHFSGGKLRFRGEWDKGRKKQVGSKTDLACVLPPHPNKTQKRGRNQPPLNIHIHSPHMGVTK